MWITPSVLDELVDRALREDLYGGDLTTQATVPAHQQAKATAGARSPLVVCGFEVFARVFTRVSPACQVSANLPDGSRAKAGDVLWTVQGPAQALLMAERVALNFCQRMSGIATQTATYADQLAGLPAKVTDTRKTTPGLRILERYAVRCGGGKNHRDNLGSAIMIKDNHIIAAGSLEIAIEKAKERAPHPTRVEVEVDTLEQLHRAVKAGGEIILLDNFELPALRAAVEAYKDKVILEASGGITLQTLRSVGETGVDYISVGALTHSVTSADIGLDMVLA